MCEPDSIGTIRIPLDDNVMYINGNILAELQDGEKHTDHDVLVQVRVFHSFQELLDSLEQDE